MKEIVELIRESLYPLTCENKYIIDKIEYNQGCFGNTIIKLSSFSRINIEIIRDRNEMSCSISTGSRIFDIKEGIDDVFSEVFDKYIVMPSRDLDVIEYIKQISLVLLENDELMVMLKHKNKFRKISKEIQRKMKHYFKKYHI